MDKYDANDTDKTESLIKKASEGLFAFLYLENSDQGKYGSIIQSLNSQKSLGNDQYPRTIVETNNVLSNHKFDVISHKKPDKNDPKHNKNKNDKEDEEQIPLSFAQLEGKCYCCGRPGHRSPECRSKEKIPREEWAINKSQQQHVQSSSDDTKSTSASTIATKKEDEPVIGWAGMHCSFAQTLNMRELILLDSDSKDTVFCNPKYVSNIQESNEP